MSSLARGPAEDELSRAVAAFSQLYRERSGAVYAMMLRLTVSQDTAEDLAQETFLRAWRAFPGFRGDAAAATWLHTIALRVWADWNRTKPVALVGLESVDEHTFALELAIAIPDSSAELELSIARLPTQMREAVVLHYLHDYSVQEVAVALGKAPGTIKAQLHAARAHLRKELS